MKKLFTILFISIIVFQLKAQIINSEGGIAIGNAPNNASEGTIRLNGALEIKINNEWHQISTDINSTLWQMEGEDAVLKINDSVRVKVNSLNVTSFYNPGTSTGGVHITSPDGSPGLLFRGNEPETFRADIKRTNEALVFSLGATTGNPGPKMTILNDGKVGVGVENPKYKLQVNGGVYFHLGEGLELTKNNSFWGNYGDARIIRMHDGNGLNGNVDGGLVFQNYSRTDSVTKDLLVLRGNGNLGLGTITPQEKFTIYDEIGKVPAFSISDSHVSWLSGAGIRIASDFRDPKSLGVSYIDIHTQGTDETFANLTFRGGHGIEEEGHERSILTLKTNNGRVGIGTLSPAQRLQVIGNARFGQSDSEFTDIGHGGSHGFINTQGDGNLEFRHDGVTKMKLTPDGKLVIGSGSTPGNYSLYVPNGGILASEVKVALPNSSDWSDDAFDRVPPLEEMEKTIKEKSHLIGMPSADDLVNTGYSVTEMDALLLEKIEWLYLYTIEQEKKIVALENKVKKLSSLK